MQDHAVSGSNQGFKENVEKKTISTLIKTIVDDLARLAGSTADLKILEASNAITNGIWTACLGLFMVATAFVTLFYLAAALDVTLVEKANLTRGSAKAIVGGAFLVMTFAIWTGFRESVLGYNKKVIHQRVRCQKRVDL